MATFRDVNGGDLDDAARRNDHKLAKWVSQNTVPTAGFRNVVINGGFDVWQRGGTGSVSNSFGYVSADRWQIYGYGTGASATLARFAHAAGSSEPYGGTRFYANYSWVAGSDPTNSLCVVQTVIEDVRTVSGQEVTVSFWANSGSGASVGVELEQVFGTGGSPSASVQGISKKIVLTTVPTRYTITFKLPSIVGKTLGTNEDSSLRLNFWTSAGTAFNGRTGIGIQSSGNFNLWGVQLEVGRVATPFERRPIGVELELCQRYFRRLGGNVVYEVLVPSGFSANGTSGNAHLTLAPTMRITPALLNWGSLQIVLANNTAYSITAMSRSAVSSSPNNVTLDWTTAGNAANMYGYIRTNNSLAGFLELSAEL